MPGALTLLEADFTVLGVLGQGAQAVVYRVRRDDTEYAMKVLRREFAGGIREFRRQAALLAAVNDPGVQRVRLVGETADGSPFLLTDLIEGECLDTRMARGRLDEPDAVAVGAAMARTLAAVHAVDLVHRDVKPANIVITPDGEVLLLDFGLAARPGNQDTGAVAGTLTYCPPEQTGMLSRPVDARSDLYSLGAVLFECVTGEPPYAAADIGELLHLHATAPVPDPRASAPVSAALAAILGKLLAKDPDDRYQSAAGLLADLREMPGTPGLHDGPTTLAEIPFAGRDAELGSLRSRWDEAVAGRGGIVAVRGAAGSGKTRILQALIGYAETTHPAPSRAVATAAATTHPAPSRPSATAAATIHPTVLRATATTADTRPLAPIRAALDDFLNRGGDTGFRVRAAAEHAIAVLQSLSPAMAELLGAPRPADNVTPDQLASAVAGLLTALARTGPLLLHIDDAHACDDTTRLLLERLAPVLAEVPLLVALTSRDRVVAADLTVLLEPFGVDGVGALLRAMSGDRPHGPAAVARVALLTGGNPYTVLEYVRSVLDSGLAWPVWDRWETDEEGLRELALPGDAAQLVVRRIGRLAAEDLRVLRTAAVCGATFAAAPVAVAAETPARQVLDALARAGRHGLIEPAGVGAWAFRHDSIRDALLGDLGAYELRHTHDRLAAALDRPGADAYALVAHCAAGSPGLDPARLVRAARAAGERALAEYAPVTALEHLCLARDTAGEYDIELDAAFDRTLGSAYHRNGLFAEALDALDRALGRTTSRTGKAHTYQLIAQARESLGMAPEMLAAARLGLAELGRPLPASTLPMVLTAIAYVLAAGGVRLTGIGRGKGGERDRLQSALYFYAGSWAVRSMRNDLLTVVSLLQAYPSARLGDSPEHATNIISNAFFFRVLGLASLANRREANARRIAEQLGDPELSAYVDWMAALARHATGEDTGTSMLGVLEKHRDSIDTGQALDAATLLILDHVTRGDLAAAEEVNERRRPFAQRAGDTLRGSDICADACVLALRGRAGEAARLLAERGPGANAPLLQRVDLHLAQLFGALERDDLGSAFDEIDASFTSLGVGPRLLMPIQTAYYIWLGYGYLARARRAEGDQKTADLDQARRAISVLGKITRRPLAVAHRRILQAGLLHAQGRPEKALAALASAGRALRAGDSALTAYEQAILTARCHADLDVPGEAARQARFAYDLALREGWPHRARRVAAEFGLETGGRSLVAAPGHARRDRRGAALEQVSMAASRIFDPARLTRVALDETIGMLGAERAFLFLVDEATGILEPYAGRDAGGFDLAELAGYSETAVDQVRHTRDPLVFTGSEQGALGAARSVAAHGLRSILAAPLQLDDRLIGVVYLDSRVAKGVFTVDDIDLLAAVTHHVAVALETARAAQLTVEVATATRQRDLAETLRAAMTRFTATLEPCQVLRELAAVALDSSFTSASSSGAPSSHTSFAGVSSAGVSSSDSSFTADTPESGVRGWVLVGEAGGSSVRTLDGVELPLGWLLGVHEPRIGGGGDWTAALTPERLASWLVVPLDGRDGPVGALVLAAPRPDAWTDGDLRVLAALAGQAMIAYENALLFSRVRELATTDSLTGVANRRHFFELAERVLAEDGPVTALMLDIDHFKRINDTYGHQAGDDVIQEVVNRLVAILDGTPGFVGRYGGEEFALLIPGGTGVAELGERLRATVAATPVTTRSGEVSVTISVGGTRRSPGETAPDLLLGRADAGLYQAKQGGRNRVVAHEP